MTHAPQFSGRIEARFQMLRQANRAGLVTFVMAGDPDTDTAKQIIFGLPQAGADIIEIGMPFSDPMADGPAIQEAGLRALKAGQTLAKTLDLVGDFRRQDDATPIILMGYYNPIHAMGVDPFITAAVKAGVDGIIVVDMPPEEDGELCLPARAAGLHFIRLATPTTDQGRLPAVLAHAGGFLYYVAVAGVTGAKSAASQAIAGALAKLRAHTPLPVAVGFGIKTPDAARLVAQHADGVVVGSAIVEQIKAGLDGDGRAKPGLVKDVLAFVKTLSDAVSKARL